MSDWEDWGVLTTPSSLTLSAPPVPRAHLQDISDFQSLQGAQVDLLNHHWKQIVGILDQRGGYDQLLTLSERLLAREEGISEHLEKAELRRRYFQWMRQKYLEKPAQWLDESAAHNDLEKARHEPMGSAFVSRSSDGLVDGWDREPEGPWTLTQSLMQSSVKVPLPGSHLTIDDTSSWTLQDFSVRYRPGEETPDLHEVDENLNRGHLTSLFSADKTWVEVAEALQSKAENAQQLCDKLGRTTQMIRFRREVIDVILYRYELFGEAGNQPQVLLQASSASQSTSTQLRQLLSDSSKRLA